MVKRGFEIAVVLIVRSSRHKYGCQAFNATVIIIISVAFLDTAGERFYKVERFDVVFVVHAANNRVVYRINRFVACAVACWAW